MSKCNVVVEEFDRMDKDKFGKDIPIYRRKITRITSEQVRIFEREDKIRKAQNDPKPTP